MTFLRRLFYLPFINFLYRNLLYPIKNILPYKFKIPIVGIVKIKYKYKPIKFFSNETSPMTRILYWEDEGCTFEFSNVFIELIKHSNTFFDIGANVGYFSLLSEAVKPDIKTYAFEPSKGPSYFLKTNLGLNLSKSITVVNKAVGNGNGSIDFFEEKNPKYPYLEYHASGIGNTVNTWGISNFSKYSVELVTLDDYVIQNKIDQIDLIKMDTEGTENLVLEGALNSIKLFSPIIICEVLENKIEEKIEFIIKNLGYNIFEYKDNLQKLSKIDSFKSSNININRNFFFIPDKKLHLVNKFIVH